MIPIGSGTHTTAGTAEETLVSIVAPGRYRLALDLNALVGGATPDIYEVRIKANVLPAGTERLLRLLGFTGGLVTDLRADPDDFVVSNTATITIKRAQGATDRAIPWALMRERPVGTVQADGGNTALTFKTNLTEVNDHWNVSGIRFLTGSLAGQVRLVSDFVQSTGFITVSTAFTAAPSAGDDFELVNV